MKLFWRIFLSFWLATILMTGLVLVLNEFVPLPFYREGNPPFEPRLADATITQAVDAYEQRGGRGFLSELYDGGSIRRNGPVYLFDENSVLLVNDGIPRHSYARLASDGLATGTAALRRLDLRTLFVCPVRSASGRRYVVVLTIFEPRMRLLRPRFWFNIIVGLLPAALVCMALTLYITRPITRLRTTARRLAAGDLSARSFPHRIPRRDELGDLAREFDAMAAQIEGLMTAQRRFVADVSHELGAPLTRMHLALALLRRQFAGAHTAELQRIERETDRLSNLVQQLLLLAGLEAGALPAESLTCLSMRLLCDSLVEDVSFEAEHADCKITGSRQEITLLAYPQLLRRAIDNVLRNAIRFAPRGSEIELNCRLSSDRSQAIVEVLDSGPGVPEAMLSEIFRPFVRASPERASATGGTGLGLAIAAEAAHLHEGTIRAQNRREGGFQLTITLPLRTSAAAEAELQSAGEPLNM